jgi:hypothetical protein
MQVAPAAWFPLQNMIIIRFLLVLFFLFLVVRMVLRLVVRLLRFNGQFSSAGQSQGPPIQQGSRKAEDAEYEVIDSHIRDDV